ncbi:unnamed protein product [Caenorhabditis bovis]|uniref:Uncharacterized protein n=1 Tax=Caenorhabditis bovis TaxID=2654633 RepID=A0A8S1EPJ7_9PELO|nr:unnamed protein product [Caenorhabditis bovis]
MRALLTLLIVFGIIAPTFQLVNVRFIKNDDPKEVDVVMVGTTVPTSAAENGDYSEEQENDSDERLGFEEVSMGKRSIALGRSGFRPGKRSITDISGEDIKGYAMAAKRSMAIGRHGLRPGKRSMAYGRLHFRPGKRSMAYGRQGFRPGKRAMIYYPFPQFRL